MLEVLLLTFGELCTLGALKEDLLLTFLKGVSTKSNVWHDKSETNLRFVIDLLQVLLRANKHPKQNQRFCQTFDTNLKRYGAG